MVLQTVIVVVAVWIRQLVERIVRAEESRLSEQPFVADGARGTQKDVACVANLICENTLRPSIAALDDVAVVAGPD